MEPVCILCETDARSLEGRIIYPETGGIVPTSRQKKQADKSGNGTPDCGEQYEEAKQIISRQEQEIYG